MPIISNNFFIQFTEYKVITNNILVFKFLL